MADIDLFFDLIAEYLSSELDDLDSADIEIKHWVVVEDDLGVAISVVGDEPHPHVVLGTLIDGGATGAAYITHNPGAEIVVANALVADPRNSDIRRAHVVKAGEMICLEPWEYTG